MVTSSVVWKVMFGASLLGAAAALVGSFAVLRRRALMGDMLSHAALPGIVLAFMLVGSRDLLSLSAGALATGLLGVVCVAAIARWTRTTEDAAIGIVLSTFFGAGIVLLTVVQKNADGTQAGLNNYLFGEIASLQSRDLLVIGVAAVVMLVLVVVFYKELKVLSFDHDFASAQGWPTTVLDLAVMAAVTVVTVIGLPVCGVVLMAAMLITPAAAARFWSNRLGPMLLVATMLGALGGALGCLLAAPKLLQALGLGWLPVVASKGMPPGPTIVLAGSLLLVLSMFLAPERGVIARWWGEQKLRRRVVRDHLIRGIYELSEPNVDDRPWVLREDLVGHIAGKAKSIERWLRIAAKEELVELNSEAARFTPAGLTTAVKLVRAHRLWELYLLEDTARDAHQVHAGADDIEHLLPEEVVKHLEEMLESEGKLSIQSPGEVPASPHATQ